METDAPGLDLLTLFVVFGLSHGLLTLILSAVWRESPSLGVGRLALGQGGIFLGALLAASTDRCRPSPRATSRPSTNAILLDRIQAKKLDMGDGTCHSTHRRKRF